MRVFIVKSAEDISGKTGVEIEMVTFSEKAAEDFANEMDECCTEGRWYSYEIWEVGE